MTLVVTGLLCIRISRPHVPSLLSSVSIAISLWNPILIAPVICPSIPPYLQAPCTRYPPYSDLPFLFCSKNNTFCLTAKPCQQDSLDTSNSRTTYQQDHTAKSSKVDSFSGVWRRNGIPSGPCSSALPRWSLISLREREDMLAKGTENGTMGTGERMGQRTFPCHDSGCC